MDEQQCQQNVQPQQEIWRDSDCWEFTADKLHYEDGTSLID